MGTGGLPFLHQQAGPAITDQECGGASSSSNIDMTEMLGSKEDTLPFLHLQTGTGVTGTNMVVAYHHQILK